MKELVSPILCMGIPVLILIVVIVWRMLYVRRRDRILGACPYCNEPVDCRDTRCPNCGENLPVAD